MARSMEGFELPNTRSQLRRAVERVLAFHSGAVLLDECEHMVDDSYERLGKSAGSGIPNPDQGTPSPLPNTARVVRRRRFDWKPRLALLRAIARGPTIALNGVVQPSNPAVAVEKPLTER